MIASVVYVLCALTALACAVLLFRGYRASGARLLLWSAVCFAGLTLNPGDLDALRSVDARQRPDQLGRRRRSDEPVPAGRERRLSPAA